MSIDNDPALTKLKLSKREKQLEEMAIHMSEYNEKMSKLLEENQSLKATINELLNRLAHRVIHISRKSSCQWREKTKS